MLDSTGKLLERLLLQRLEKHLDEHGGRRRAPNQCGFCKGISIETAVNSVLNIAAQAATTPRKKSLCVLVTLDVKNAFNSLRWPVIDIYEPDEIAELRKTSLAARRTFQRARKRMDPDECREEKQAAREALKALRLVVRKRKENSIVT